MLNADMALVKDLEGWIDHDSGFVFCSLTDDCPDSPLLDFVLDFAQDNAVWIQAFRDAFWKMTSVGCSNVDGDVCTKVEGLEEYLQTNPSSSSSRAVPFVGALFFSLMLPVLCL